MFCMCAAVALKLGTQARGARYLIAADSPDIIQTREPMPVTPSNVHMEYKKT